MKILKKTINIFLIILFIILGFVGLALPIVPQAVFFAIALILISFEIPPLERYIEKKLIKFPEILKVYVSIKNVLEKYLK